MSTDRDKYYMSIAFLTAKNSKCLSAQRGAILVKDDSIISTGYNGPARGVSHCGDKGGCIRRKQSDFVSGSNLDVCPAVHAEQNCVAFAAYNGVSTKGSICYCTTFPCKDCMNSLINAGVKKVVYSQDYNAPVSKSIASESKIELEQFTGDLIIYGGDICE